MCKVERLGLLIRNTTLLFLLLFIPARSITTSSLTNIIRLQSFVGFALDRRQMICEAVGDDEFLRNRSCTALPTLTTRK